MIRAPFAAARDGHLRLDFASDTVVGLAPEALCALVDANEGACRPYGGDLFTTRAADAIRARLDADAEIRFVLSGTAANAIALSILAQPYEAVFAHEAAHITCDEVGAPAFFGHGLGIVTLPGKSAKIALEALDCALEAGEAPQRQPPAAISFTNATEYGDIYETFEFQVLLAKAKAAGLRTHLDGARLANAAAAGFNLHAASGQDLDIMSFGGAKAGAGCVEAIVIFDKSLAQRLDHRLKQAGQTPAKTRLLTAPLLGLMESGAWDRGAESANRMAGALAAGVLARTPYAIRHPVKANMVFLDLPEIDRERLEARRWAAVRSPDGSVRFVCSWATTAELIEELVDDLAAVAALN